VPIHFWPGLCRRVASNSGAHFPSYASWSVLVVWDFGGCQGSSAFITTSWLSFPPCVRGDTRVCCKSGVWKSMIAFLLSPDDLCEECGSEECGLWKRGMRLSATAYWESLYLSLSQLTSHSLDIKEDTNKVLVSTRSGIATSWLTFPPLLYDELMARQE